MIFNSIPFALFLPIVFIIYWRIGSKNSQAQNRFLLVASLFFYGWWDFRFLGLLFVTSLFTYGIGFLLQKEITYRRVILFLGLLFTLSFLLLFKYYNFFVDSFCQAYSLFGGEIKPEQLDLILPLGISFYTFKLVGYLIDVFYKKIEVVRKFEDFFLFASFFPQISAGPIESAASLMPQIKKKREFNYSQISEGLRYILWGLFKKVVIADTCALYANDIFGNYAFLSGSTLALGALYFSIQVYADFSGYSDIAIGVGKLFGFELMKNFNLPFLSKNVTDFWRRWHISLTVWFNDYFFTPLFVSVRNWGKLGMYFAIFSTFLLSGLWHGANWNYILYGALQGLAIIIETATSKRRKKIQKQMSAFWYLNLSIAITMLYILFTFIIFRSPNTSSGFDYLNQIFSNSFFEFPEKLAYLPLIALLISWEWLQRHKNHALDLPFKKRSLRWTVYLLLTFSVLYFYGQEQAFYYFQF